jgi:hypothetical protein
MSVHAMSAPGQFPSPSFVAGMEEPASTPDAKSRICCADFWLMKC